MKSFYFITVLFSIYSEILSLFILNKLSSIVRVQKNWKKYNNLKRVQ